MTNVKKARWAHDVLDGLFAGRILSRENEQLLRSFLPELPKQKTLEEIAELVNEAWGDAHVNDWNDDTHGSLESWLSDLEMQLRGLANTKPAHPEFLETEADYQNAPEGTIVAIGDESPRMKYENVWPAYVNSIARNYDLSGTCRRVLRWGWGDK